MRREATREYKLASGQSKAYTPDGTISPSASPGAWQKTIPPGALEEQEELEL